MYFSSSRTQVQFHLKKLNSGIIYFIIFCTFKSFCSCGPTFTPPPPPPSSEENEFHICVRVCGVEGRGKSLSGQFFFVCEKDDRGESSTKSLGGMTRPKDETGSQIVSSESDISHPIRVYLNRNNNSQAQARRFPALTAPEPEFPVIFGSK